MFSRKFAAIAISAGLLLTTAGCSFNPHPDSLQSYAPSDGAGADVNLVQADGAATGEVVKLRNFLYLTNGSTGKLYGTIINGGTKQQVVTVNYQPQNGVLQTNTVFVKPGQAVAFNEVVFSEDPISLDGKAGDIAKVSFGLQANSIWTELNVPLLDGTLPEYKDLVASLEVKPELVVPTDDAAN